MDELNKITDTILANSKLNDSDIAAQEEFVANFTSMFLSELVSQIDELNLPAAEKAVKDIEKALEDQDSDLGEVSKIMEATIKELPVETMNDVVGKAYKFTLLTSLQVLLDDDMISEQQVINVLKQLANK